VVVSAFALFLPAGLLLVHEGSMDPQYSARYRLLSALPTPDAFRAAALADQLALLTLVLAVTGLLALMEWQSLFPSARDYLALAEPQTGSPPSLRVPRLPTGTSRREEPWPGRYHCSVAADGCALTGGATRSRVVLKKTLRLWCVQMVATDVIEWEYS
jgi:hypothetical protein